jgi:hypothetical protein
MSQKQNSRSIWHPLGTFLAVLVILLVYAYGFQITQVNLEKPKEERRQIQLTNIIRGLVRPRLLEYEEERVEVEALVMMPCNPQVSLPPVDTSGRYIELTPNCVELGGEVTVKGYNFEPGETVYLFFVPEAASIHEVIELRLADESINVDSQGRFTYVAEMRKDRPSDEPQIVRAVVKIRSGLPQPSATLKDTLSKINHLPGTHRHHTGHRSGHPHQFPGCPQFDERRGQSFWQRHGWPAAGPLGLGARFNAVRLAR